MFKLKVPLSYVALVISACAIYTLAQGPNGSNGPGSNKLICFDGESNPDIFGGVCTLGRGRLRNTATLETNPDSFDGSYAGVYSNHNVLAGTPLEDVTDLKFSYSGTGTFAPEFRLPIDTDANGTTDLSVFIPGQFCDDDAGNVDVTATPGCFLFIVGGTSEAITYPAFQTRFPGSRIATDNDPFIVARIGIWTVNNVSFGRPGNN